MSTDMRQFAPLSPSCVPDMRRQVWGRMFGEGIQGTRESAGLSHRGGSQVSRMEASEWMAIEQGYVPQDTNRLHAMADAMGIRFDQDRTDRSALPGSLGVVGPRRAEPTYTFYILTS